MISGDLGNAGQVALIPEVIAPHFDVATGDLGAGFNLLQAYLQLDRLEEGEALLSALYKRNLPPYKSKLDTYSDAYQKKRLASAISKPVDPDAIQPVMLPFTEPIWHYGLRNPEWLFPPKPKEVPVVGFLSLAKIVAADAQAEEQREDDLGRLTRAIPLYLAEAVHEWTDRPATTYLHAIPGGGPVVYGGEPQGGEIHDSLPSELSHFISGSIRALEVDNADSTIEISMSLWDRKDGRLISREVNSSVKKDVGHVVRQLEMWLLEQLGNTRSTPWDLVYQQPDSEMMNPYLNELGILMTLTLVANHLSSRDSIWGERNMLAFPLNMSLTWASSKVCRLMFMSGLSRAMDYESTVLEELKPQTLTFLKEDSSKQGVLREFEPLIYKFFSMHEDMNRASERLAEKSTEQYIAWLSRLKN